MQAIDAGDMAITCSLSAVELEQRRETVLAELRGAVEASKETEVGFAFRLSGGDAILEKLMHLIRLERACCPFITFKLTAEAHNGPIWFELSAPPDAKPMIADFLGIA